MISTLLRALDGAALAFAFAAPLLLGVWLAGILVAWAAP